MHRMWGIKSTTPLPILLKFLLIYCYIVISNYYYYRFIKQEGIENILKRQAVMEK
jgi:uncharacterized membrane protein